MSLMHIPKYIDHKLGDMFAEITETTESEFEVTGNIEAIEHKSRDGFIPFTNGGLSFNAPINLDYLNGSGKGFVNAAVEKTIEKTVDYAYKGALSFFIAEHRAELKSLFTTKQLDNNSGDINYHTLYSLHNGALAEELSETESAWLECTLFVEHRIQFYAADNSRNETGSDEICFLSGVNTDYDYGRDKGLEITFNRTVELDNLTPKLIKEITKEMLATI